MSKQDKVLASVLPDGAYVDAERGLIGALMAGPERALELVNGAGVTGEEYFYLDSAKVCWNGIMELMAEGAPVTEGTLWLKLKSKGYESESGGLLDFISKAAEQPSAEAAGYYAEAVMRGWRKRQVWAEAERMRAEIGSKDPVAVASESAARLLGIVEGERKGSLIKTAREVAEEAVEGIAGWAKIDELKIGLGWDVLDGVLHLEGRKLMTVAARTGGGKSTFLGQLAVESSRRGTGVLVISLEMSARQYGQRFLSYMSGVKLNTLRRNMLKEELEAYQKAQEELKGLEIYFLEGGGMSVMEIRGHIERMVRRNGIKLVLIDYLQLVLPGKRCETREQEVAHVSGVLRHIVGDHGIVVVAASQLNRDIEKTGGRPKLSSLRESGAIENDSDIVLFIHNENEEGMKDKPVLLMIAKNRDGESRVLESYYDRARFKFMPWSERTKEPF